MKTNDLNELKTLDAKALLARAKSIKQEIADLIMDKNMSKLKDVRSISKKRKEIAQMLTVARQKQLMEQLEEKVTKKEPEVSVENKGKTK